jgi:hypothetical protein
VAPRGSHRFSRLLKCQCGRILTPRVGYAVKPDGRRYGPYVSYQCYDGRHDPDHPRPYMVAEAAIIEWAKAEAARLRLPERVELSAPDARRDDLEEDRRRAGIAYNARAMGDDEFTATIARIEDELADLDGADRILEVPAIDWSKEPKSINEVLRAMWRYVELDAAMKPIRAEWIREEWRA